MVWRNGTPCAHSEESEAETKRPPINQNSHLTQNLASGANLACSGKGFAPGASFLYLVLLFVLEVEVNTANIGYCDDENHH